MSNCKFLKQKKQVQINGEWVDTRSYRYTLYCDGNIPCVIITGADPRSSISIFYYKINNPSIEKGKDIKIDDEGNGYIEFESDDSITGFRINSTVELSVNFEIKGCNVSGFYLRDYTSNFHRLTVSCSTYYRPNLDKRFDNSSEFTELTFKGFDTSNATTMSGMFKDLGWLHSLDVTHFDTSNVTDMKSMFYDCGNFTSLDLSNFNTSKVTNMALMFADSNKLTSLDLSSFNTSNVTDMGGMFRGCSGLKSLDLSGWNTSNVTSMDSMFKGCTSLTSIRMVGCEKPTIDKIKAQLTKDNITGVTIVTE